MPMPATSRVVWVETAALTIAIVHCTQAAAARAAAKAAKRARARLNGSSADDGQVHVSSISMYLCVEGPNTYPVGTC